MAERQKSKTSRKNDVNLETLSAGLEIGNKPPQALDFEEAVLAALLVEPNCVDDTLEGLTPSCFYGDKNRMIFEAIVNVNKEHAKPDMLTVVEQLRRDGNLEAVGGPVAIARLTQKIGTASQVEYYVSILKQKNIQRELITASYSILKDAYSDSVKVDDLIDNAQTKIFAAIQNNVKRDVQDIASVINRAISDLEKRQDMTGFSGVPSGFISLDEVTQGWQPSDLIILAARPSVGKTAFALNIARNAAVDHNQPVAFFSLEMPAIQLVKRLMVSETGLEADKIKGGRKLEPYEWTQLEVKLKGLSKAPLYIDDTPSLPVMEFRSKAKKLVRQKGVKLILVDYLQLMQGPAELRGFREQEVAAISRTLKATAKELNVPIIALSQLSRAAVTRTGSNNRPQLNDLRESGSIEQDADLVIFIHRADYQGLSDKPEDIGRTEIILAKHRNGEIKDIPMTYRASEVRFVDNKDTLVANINLDYPQNQPMSQGYVPASQLAQGEQDFGSNVDF